MVSFKIHWMTPKAPSCQHVYMLDTLPFRIGLETHRNENALSMFKPEDYRVEIWTNLYHKTYNEGDWHAVPMKYQNTKQVVSNDTVYYIYGEHLILTCLGEYSFTFRARSKYDADYVWAEHFEIDGHVNIRQPVIERTTWVQEPKVAQITHNIFLGNYAAAMKAPENGFDCLLNMADDAAVYAQQFVNPIIYHKFPVPAGANNPIGDEVISTAVRWLRTLSDGCRKIMVSSRAGRGRAGSILLAFIFYMNPNLSFEEAYDYVDKRFFIYNHKGLKDSLMRLYR